MTNEPVNDYDLTVTVRLYGFGDAQDAAQVMNSYTGTFVLPNGDECEIIAVQPSPVTADAPEGTPRPETKAADASG